MRPLFLLCTIGFVAAFMSFGARVEDEQINEEIHRIVEEAKADPQQLQRLKDYPYELVFPVLKRVWLESLGQNKTRQHVLKSRGREAEIEWVETEKSIGRDPDAADKLFPVAQ